MKEQLRTWRQRLSHLDSSLALPFTSCVTSGFDALSVSFPICALGLKMLPVSEVPVKVKRDLVGNHLTELSGGGARCI